MAKSGISVKSLWGKGSGQKQERRAFGLKTGVPRRAGRRWLTGRGLFLLPVILAGCLTWTQFFILDQKNTTAGSDYLPCRLHAGDVLVQQFQPVKDGLCELTLSFDLPENCSLPEETQIRLDLKQKGDSAPAEQILLTEENLQVYARTKVPVHIGHRTAGKTCDLILTVEKLPEKTQLALHTSHTGQADLQVNGRDTGVTAVMSLTFRTFNTLHFSLAVLLLSVIYALLFLPLPRCKALMTKFPVLPLLVVPALTLIDLEILNTLNQDGLLAAPVFLLTYLIILLVELIAAGLSGQVRLGLYLNLILFSALGMINHVKLFFRGDPFIAGDLLSVGETAQTIDQLLFAPSSRFLLALLLLIINLLLVVRVRNTRWPPGLRWPLTAVSLALLLLLGQGLVLQPDRLRAILGIHPYPWNQMVQYNQNGVVIPFIQSTRNQNTSVPDHTDALSADLFSLPPQARRDQADPQKPNIIAIMSESFADFANIRPIETSEPVTPFFRQLQHDPNVRHGNLLVSIFGGGTCNTEFEFLTGSSMLFLADGSLPYNSYFSGKTHALPDLLGQQGYRCVAIHPFLPTFWNRNRVYPAIGFDSFISLEDFSPGGLVRDFVGAQADFAQIIRTYEAKRPDERLFIFSVTMQNHFPYISSEEILSGLKYNIRLPAMTQVESVELYLSLLRQSDDALRDLITYFSRADEPTLIVLFGDHLPGNNSVFQNFYESLFNKQLASLTLQETEKIYETPWLIWANYDLPQLAEDVISPNFLGTMVLDLAGAAKSPYFEQVSQLHTTIAAMSNKMVIRRDGRTFDRESLPENLIEPLNRYRAVEYENVIRDKTR
jgi:phosphoglycerol transferase MdoB-like AlkP superfamily enzyme